MRRLFNAHVQMVYEDERVEASVSSSVASRTEFWWNPARPEEDSLWESKIELGWDFFNEIIRRPVPLDMNTLKGLKRSSLGLDLYMWLTYRTFCTPVPAAPLLDDSCTASSERTRPKRTTSVTVQSFPAARCCASSSRSGPLGRNLDYARRRRGGTDSLADQARHSSPAEPLLIHREGVSQGSFPVPNRVTF